jgi:hypothetical protein
MQRETKTVTTPEGKELILKTFMNARERNAIKSAFLEGIKIDPNDIAKKDNSEILQECDASIMLKAEKRMFEQLIVSYAGSPENISERLENESPKEYDFVVDELNKITAGNFEKAK